MISNKAEIYNLTDSDIGVCITNIILKWSFSDLGRIAVVGRSCPRKGSGSKRENKYQEFFVPGVGKFSIVCLSSF